MKPACVRLARMTITAMAVLAASCSPSPDGADRTQPDRAAAPSAAAGSKNVEEPRASASEPPAPGGQVPEKVSVPAARPAPKRREPTRAAESRYNQDMRLATTSSGLSLADLAWHAVNTYGWDCEEVVKREPQQGDYYVITCSNGTRLRVYPRSGAHPKIMNTRGGYD